MGACELKKLNQRSLDYFKSKSARKEVCESECFHIAWLIVFQSWIKSFKFLQW